MNGATFTGAEGPYSKVASGEYSGRGGQKKVMEEGGGICLPRTLLPTHTPCRRVVLVRALKVYYTERSYMKN